MRRLIRCPGLTRAQNAWPKISVSRLPLQVYQLVVTSPTIPIGLTKHPTPPTFSTSSASAFSSIMTSRLNPVDVWYVAAGLMLAMQRGRHGQRYVLGGDNITLAELLTIVSDIGGHKALRFGVPSVVAEAAAVTL